MLTAGPAGRIVTGGCAKPNSRKKSVTFFFFFGVFITYEASCSAASCSVPVQENIEDSLVLSRALCVLKGLATRLNLRCTGCFLFLLYRIWIYFPSADKD